MENMKRVKKAVSMKPVTYILFFVLGTALFLCLVRTVKIPVSGTNGQDIVAGEESISLFEAIFVRGGNL